MYAQQLHIIQTQMAQIEPRMKAYLDAALQKAATISREAPAAPAAPVAAELDSVITKLTQLESTVTRLESAINKLESETKTKFAQIDNENKPPSPTAASLVFELNTDDIVIEERKKTKRGGGGAVKKGLATVELECA